MCIYINKYIYIYIYHVYNIFANIYIYCVYLHIYIYLYMYVSLFDEINISQYMDIDITGGYHLVGMCSGILQWKHRPRHLSE